MAGQFLYGIAKISLWPNFHYDSEISLLSKRKFAIIAKITVHSKILIFTMPAIFSMIVKFRNHSEFFLP